MPDVTCVTYSETSGRRPTGLGSTLSRKTLELRSLGGEVGHRVGDGRVAGLLGDEAMHLLGHASVCRMSLGGRPQLDQVCCLAGVHLHNEPQPAREGNDVGRLMREPLGERVRAVDAELVRVLAEGDPDRAGFVRRVVEDRALGRGEERDLDRVVVPGMPRAPSPFGIAQVGKSFRNEITPGNFIFRTREFEQMEMEYFVPPDQSAKWFEYWVQHRHDWYVEHGIPADQLMIRPHDPDELSHYSTGTSDIEFAYPWGWGELEGIAQRTDFDLGKHAEFSGEELVYFDQESNTKYVPYVIEPAAGADRATLAFLLSAYDEEEVNGETRTVLRLHKRLAPIKVAVLPLSKKDTLVPLTEQIAASLRPHFQIDTDASGAIGRRYRRFDEIGTPYCVTIDFDSLDDHSVTVRERDSMEQVRIPVAGLLDHLRTQFED